MNTELRKNAKHDLSKKILKLVNNAVFGKTTENVRKLRDIKLVPNRNNKKLCSFRTKQPYINFFSDKLLAIEMESMDTHKQTCLYRSFNIRIGKIVMYRFWYNYRRPKYGEKAKVYYMDTNSFVVNIKTKDIYLDIAKDV